MKMKPLQLYQTFELPVGYKFGSGSLAILDRRVEATVHAVTTDDRGRPLYRIEFVNPRNGRGRSTWIAHMQALRAMALSRKRKPWRRVK